MGISSKKIIKKIALFITKLKKDEKQTNKDG